ncbi:uncharacterized protein LOC141863588 isoform X2 [Acropora palmata]|uniref:uncharacterized protein LOC141863588 isoform X2 n=1 Tax=Acropora palmata TaxID=6131 RepID=UPI003DA05F30
MPKSFLLKRKSTNTSTSKLQNRQKEHEDQKEESLTSEDRSIQSKILTESPKAPTDSSHVVFEAKDEFATPTASPVKYSPEQPFSIYSPFYGLPFPGVADNSHNNFDTYFNTLPSDFSLQAQVRIYFKTPQVNCRSPILNVDFILRK